MLIPYATIFDASFATIVAVSEYVVFVPVVTDVIVGASLSIFVICLLAVITFPAKSVAVAYIYPFAVTVTFVVGAVAELADVCAFANVVPYPAFLVFDVVTSGYVIVAVIS